MPLIDPNKNPVGVDKRLQGERDPARRRMLEEVRFHIATEAAGSIEPALARLAPSAEYIIYDHSTAPVHIRGVDAIRANFYDTLVARIEPRLEWDIVLCMVDGRSVITEGQQKNAVRGTTLRQLDIDVDPDLFYWQDAHHMVVWPFDDELRLIGETVFMGYSTPPHEVARRPLRPEDIGTYVGRVIEPV